MVAAPELSPAFEDYLKAIWTSQEWSDTPITTNALAGRMGFAPSTISEAVKKLSERGLVTHRKYGSIDLTEQGRAAALQVVRRHRIIETFLVQHLGYGWDEVHDEAEILEHAVSDTLIERLSVSLGNPTRDPHGDAIPSMDGRVDRPPAVALDTVPVGGVYTVSRVADTSPEVLRYLRDAAILLDVSIAVDRRNDAAGVMSVTVGEQSVELGIAAAAAVWVAPARNG